MRPNLTLERFLELAAEYPVVPVAMEILADRETPVSMYERLVGDREGFLLESVEGGERWARWSFAGWSAEFALIAEDGACRVEGARIDLPDGDPLTVLAGLLERYRTPDSSALGLGDPAPPLYAGCVGYLGYDAVRYIEHLPNRPPDDRGLPEMVWQFVGHLAIFDRYRQTVQLVVNVYVRDDPEEQYREAVETLVSLASRLADSVPYVAAARPAFVDRPEATSTFAEEEFERAVTVCIEHIKAGDAFQIVPSLRLEVAFGGDPFDVYRSLRLVNPSPFMFYVRSGDLALVGSSPELMSRVRDGKATSRPIAGTRPRGADAGEDEQLADDLLHDPKERAEHVMLVDLARNDLGRVCEFGSVVVDELMVIERYSHVMHIVSGVSGTLRPDVGPVDVLRATFPHGTVSGAPKVRAMEIIDELEPVARGPYAGAVGYLDFSGNVDTAIALRTLVIAGGKAWVQAGAGIVADSDPAAEYRECLNKAEAALAAVAAARELDDG